MERGASSDAERAGERRSPPPLRGSLSFSRPPASTVSAARPPRRRHSRHVFRPDARPKGPAGSAPARPRSGISPCPDSPRVCPPPRPCFALGSAGARRAPSGVSSHAASSSPSAALPLRPARPLLLDDRRRRRLLLASSSPSSSPAPSAFACARSRLTISGNMATPAGSDHSLPGKGGEPGRGGGGATEEEAEVALGRETPLPCLPSVAFSAQPAAAREARPPGALAPEVQQRFVGPGCCAPCTPPRRAFLARVRVPLKGGVGGLGGVSSLII